MLDKTSGEVRIDGNDISDKDAVRRTFGIVFQDSSLDDELTGRENMYFHAMLYGIPRSIQEKEITRLLEFVGLRAFRDRIVKQYSGGMKRRLEIARGLLHHPKILYLDEPTVGLDPQSRIHIRSYLKNINQEEGLTIFLTTHYMDEVEKIADRIAIIDHGKIQAIGTLNELKELTGKQTLDEVFVAMTGRDIREELLSENDSNKTRKW
jgi:ABC-2 type transport system ATP-binding protein